MISNKVFRKALGQAIIEYRNTDPENYAYGAGARDINNMACGPQSTTTIKWCAIGMIWKHIPQQSSVIKFKFNDQLDNIVIFHELRNKSQTLNLMIALYHQLAPFPLISRLFNKLD